MQQTWLKAGALVQLLQLLQLLQLPQGLAQLPHFTCKDRTGEDRVGPAAAGPKRTNWGGGGGTPTADAVGQVGELLGVVQHLHALGVGVVAHREGFGDGGCELPDEDPEETSIIRSPLPRRPHRGPAPQPTSLSLWHFQSCRQQSRRAGTP